MSHLFIDGATAQRKPRKQIHFETSSHRTSGGKIFTELVPAKEPRSRRTALILKRLARLQKSAMFGSRRALFLCSGENRVGGSRRWRNGFEPRHTLCCMLHCSLVGGTQPQRGGCRPGWLPDPYDQSQSGNKSRRSEMRPFRLEVTQGQDRETIEFLLDGNTEVQRKLEIGS
jgi:hypothetical protein